MTESADRTGERIRDVAQRRGADETQMARALNAIKARQRGDEPPKIASARSVVFGTDPSCDVRIDDEYASSRHCVIHELEDGRVTVEDLGSLNGTTVRRTGQHWTAGVRVYSRTPISPGMIVRIGRTDLPWRAS